ncbi:alpha/beta fold hydrolase [Pediococcus pentosaceus]|uniref:alpha/beta fold hydrolase n=1 Tax=Pediococcus pentosaceus TaxID=1255 RepID=UPI001ED8C599|nr:alpha/beta fold hydrolase [Pediococcus pentosaceus]
MKDKVHLFCFLTGFGGNTEIWSGQVNFFLQRGYRVIRLDYLNHGQSDRVDGELQIGDLADEVLQLVDYLQLKEPIGIGNSMGAAVLWNIINLRGWDFLSKAIFVDQSPKMLNDQQWHLGFILESFLKKRFLGYLVESSLFFKLESNSGLFTNASRISLR